MGIEQKMKEPIGLMTATTMAVIAIIPFNCSEPLRASHEAAEQRQMMPDMVPVNPVEDYLKHMIYTGPTISEYRGNKHDLGLPTIPPKRKDWRFYDNKAIIPSSMRTTAEKALRRMPEPDPQPRNNQYDQTRAAMLMYARSGPRR